MGHADNQLGSPLESWMLRPVEELLNDAADRRRHVFVLPNADADLRLRLAKAVLPSLQLEDTPDAAPTTPSRAYRALALNDKLSRFELVRPSSCSARRPKSVPGSSGPAVTSVLLSDASLPIAFPCHSCPSPIQDLLATHRSRANTPPGFVHVPRNWCFADFETVRSLTNDSKLLRRVTAIIDTAPRYLLARDNGRFPLMNLQQSSDAPAGGHEVVLKLYHKHPSTAAAVSHEVRTHFSISHPNIETAYAVIEEDGVVGLLLEYFSQGTLQSLLAKQERRQLSPEDVRRLVLRPCIAALVYLHSRGICHHAISDSTLFLTCDGTAKLGTFAEWARRAAAKDDALASGSSCAAVVVGDHRTAAKDTPLASGSSGVAVVVGDHRTAAKDTPLASGSSGVALAGAGGRAAATDNALVSRSSGAVAKFDSCHTGAEDTSLASRSSSNTTKGGCHAAAAEDPAPAASARPRAPPEEVCPGPQSALTAEQVGKGDIWALGLLAFELLVGRSVFEAPDGTASNQYSPCDGFPPMYVSFPDFVPQRARMVLLSMLALNPLLRPSAAELARDPWIADPAGPSSFPVPDVDEPFADPLRPPPLDRPQTARAARAHTVSAVAARRGSSLGLPRLVDGSVPTRGTLRLSSGRRVLLADAVTQALQRSSSKRGAGVPRPSLLDTASLSLHRPRASVDGASINPAHFITAPAALAGVMEPLQHERGSPALSAIESSRKSSCTRALPRSDSDSSMEACPMGTEASPVMLPGPTSHAVSDSSPGSAHAAVAGLSASHVGGAGDGAAARGRASVRLVYGASTAKRSGTVLNGIAPPVRLSAAQTGAEQQTPHRCGVAEQHAQALNKRGVSEQARWELAKRGSAELARRTPDTRASARQVEAAQEAPGVAKAAEREPGEGRRASAASSARPATVGCPPSPLEAQEERFCSPTASLQEQSLTVVSASPTQGPVATPDSKSRHGMSLVRHLLAPEASALRKFLWRFKHHTAESPAPDAARTAVTGAESPVPIDAGSSVSRPGTEQSVFGSAAGSIGGEVPLSCSSDVGTSIDASHHGAVAAVRLNAGSVKSTAVDWRGAGTGRRQRSGDTHGDAQVVDSKGPAGTAVCATPIEIVMQGGIATEDAAEGATREPGTHGQELARSAHPVRDEGDVGGASALVGRGSEARALIGGGSEARSGAAAASSAGEPAAQGATRIANEPHDSKSNRSTCAAGTDSDSAAQISCTDDGSSPRKSVAETKGTTRADSRAMKAACPAAETEKASIGRSGSCALGSASFDVGERLRGCLQLGSQGPWESIACRWSGASSAGLAPTQSAGKSSGPFAIPVHMPSNGSPGPSGAAVVGAGSSPDGDHELATAIDETFSPDKGRRPLRFTQMWLEAYKEKGGEGQVVYRETTWGRAGPLLGLAGPRSTEVTAGDSGTRSGAGLRRTQSAVSIAELRWPPVDETCASSSAPEASAGSAPNASRLAEAASQDQGLSCHTSAVCQYTDGTRGLSAVAAEQSRRSANGVAETPLLCSRSVQPTGTRPGRVAAAVSYFARFEKAPPAMGKPAARKGDWRPQPPLKQGAPMPWPLPKLRMRSRTLSPPRASAVATKEHLKVVAKHLIISGAADPAVGEVGEGGVLDDQLVAPHGRGSRSAQLRTPWLNLNALPAAVGRLARLPGSVRHTPFVVPIEPDP